MNIPEFVVIHDLIKSTYQHPVVHYVFEEEELPDIPKDNLILIDLDSTATLISHIDSYSPYFQVTDCVLEQTKVDEQFEESSGLMNLTVEGVSIPKSDTAGIYPLIQSLDQLKDTLFKFNTRNDMVKKSVIPSMEALSNEVMSISSIKTSTSTSN
ncbi:hypothetical protein BDB01DRAFT_851677 [Pilobolus umbonatus]|nr:hypothetical protein BDB01DRAFT_851677 [Pilobolus umbonatus]